MRLVSHWTASLLLVGVAFSASASAAARLATSNQELIGRDITVVESDVAFEQRDLLLTTRQQSDTGQSLAAIFNGTGSASGSDSDSSSSSSNTTSATNTTTSTGATCEMLGQITTNQQVSWSGKYIQACCTSYTEAVCFIRSNDDGSGSTTQKADPAACFQVPSCPTLMQGDASTMAGFRPLKSTWASGTDSNHYKFSFAAVDGAATTMQSMSSSMAIATASLLSFSLAFLV